MKSTVNVLVECTTPVTVLGQSATEKSQTAFTIDASARPQPLKPPRSFAVLLKPREAIVRSRVQEKFETAHWGDPPAYA